MNAQRHERSIHQKIDYKMSLAGRTMHKRPAQCTSKTDHRNGLMGKRNGHAFTGADGYQCDADWNAGFNLAKWDGFSCSLELKEALTLPALKRRRFTRTFCLSRTGARVYFK